MPGIFGIYGIASQALLTFQAAISTVGHNVANAGTEGFHRQRVEFRAGHPELTAVGALGTGVRIRTVQRIEDRFIEIAVRREIPVLARYQARANALAQSELAFGEPSEGGLTTLLDEFYSGWGDLASSPEDTTSRESVVRLGVSLADAVRNARNRLATQQSSISGEIARAIDESNRVVRELESLNRNMLSASRNGVVPADMEDRRDVLVRNLGELIGATATIEGDGTATVRVSGRVIVQLESSQEITFDLAVADVPTIEGKQFQAGELDGRVGGLLLVRDDDLAASLERLDEFAARLANDINEIHMRGLDSHGEETVPFFVVLGVSQNGTVGAAAGLRVNPELRKDPTRVSAGLDGSPGDNTIALDIAALRNGNAGATGLLQSLIVDAGSRARESEDQAIGQAVIVNSFEAQRESISGVSLDEEAANLLRFQRSYQAAARIMMVADEMAQTVLSL